MKISTNKPRSETQSPRPAPSPQWLSAYWHITSLLWQITCGKLNGKFVGLIKIRVFKYISRFLEGCIIFIIAVKNFYGVRLSTWLRMAFTAHHSDSSTQPGVVTHIFHFTSMHCFMKINTALSKWVGVVPEGQDYWTFIATWCWLEDHTAWISTLLSIHSAWPRTLTFLAYIILTAFKLVFLPPVFLPPNPVCPLLPEWIF